MDYLNCLKTHCAGVSLAGRKSRVKSPQANASTETPIQNLHRTYAVRSLKNVFPSRWMTRLNGQWTMKKNNTKMALAFGTLLFLLPSGGFTQSISDHYGSVGELHIPKNLEECFKELVRILPQEELLEFKNKSELEAKATAHFGLGLWIRNNWKLRSKSDLANFFNELGITHPDDMSGIIIGTFWCHLNEKPLKLAERVRFYQEYWLYNTLPKDAVSPIDGGPIDFFLSTHCNDSESKSCTLHLGIGKTDGLPWAYKHGKGIYRPTEDHEEKILEMQKRIYK